MAFAWLALAPNAIAEEISSWSFDFGPSVVHVRDGATSASANAGLKLYRLHLREPDQAFLNVQERSRKFVVSEGVSTNDESVSGTELNLRWAFGRTFMGRKLDPGCQPYLLGQVNLQNQATFNEIKPDQRFGSTGFELGFLCLKDDLLVMMGSSGEAFLGEAADGTLGYGVMTGARARFSKGRFTATGQSGAVPQIAFDGKSRALDKKRELEVSYSISQDWTLGVSVSRKATARADESVDWNTLYGRPDNTVVYSAGATLGYKFEENRLGKGRR